MTRDAPGGIRRALRNTGWLLAGRGVGAILSLVYLAIATRALGPAGFGRFVIIIGIGQAIAAIVTIQTWQAVVHFGAGQAKAGATRSLRDLVAFCGMLEGVCALAGVALGGAAILLLGPRFGWSAAIARDGMLFTTVLLLAVRSTPIGILRLHDRYRYGALADSATPLLRMIGAAILFATRPTVEGFLFVWAVSELATAGLYWILARNAAPTIVGRPDQRIWDVPNRHAGFWHLLSSTNASVALGTAAKPVSVVAVGMVLGASAAGGYRLATQLGQSLARIADLLSRGFFGEFSLAHVEHGRAGALRLFRQSVLLATLLAAIIAVIALLVGKPLLLLVAGAQYLPAYPLLVVFALAAVCDVAGFGFEPLLLAAGQARAVLWVKMAALAGVILGFALLLPTWGAMGAALAMLATSLGSYIALGILAWRTARLST